MPPNCCVAIGMCFTNCILNRPIKQSKAIYFISYYKLVLSSLVHITAVLGHGHLAIELVPPTIVLLLKDVDYVGVRVMEAQAKLPLSLFLIDDSNEITSDRQVNYCENASKSVCLFCFL